MPVEGFKRNIANLSQQVAQIRVGNRTGRGNDATPFTPRIGTQEHFAPKTRWATNCRLEGEFQHGPICCNNSAMRNRRKITRQQLNEKLDKSMVWVFVPLFLLYTISGCIWLFKYEDAGPMPTYEILQPYIEALSEYINLISQPRKTYLRGCGFWDSAILRGSYWQFWP